MSYTCPTCQRIVPCGLECPTCAKVWPGVVVFSAGCMFVMFLIAAAASWVMRWLGI